MIVVDASVVVKWAVPEPGREEALKMLTLGHSLLAPDLIFAEAANVFRKRMKQGDMTAQQSESALNALAETIHIVVPSKTLAETALRHARQLDHSVYDCFYLAAADQTSYLVTADNVFARKCSMAGISRVIVLSDIGGVPLGAEVQQ